jgi:hypothetical protein
MADKLKRMVRERMMQTGESYTMARAALIAARDPDREKSSREALEQIEWLRDKER